MTLGFGNQYSIQLSYERVIGKSRILQSEPTVILQHRARMTISFESQCPIELSHGRVEDVYCTPDRA